MASTRSAAVVLSTLQRTLRFLQLASSILILAIYSYFLAALSNRNLHTANSVRAVEGISGICILYLLSSSLVLPFLLLLLRRRRQQQEEEKGEGEGSTTITTVMMMGESSSRNALLTSFVTVLLDVAFGMAFIYVAVTNKDGAGRCVGDKLDTPFGEGKAGEKPDAGRSGFATLPSFGTACKLQTACLAVSILLIFFFIFSIVTEIALARHHYREKRFGSSSSSTSSFSSSSSSSPEKDTSSSPSHPTSFFSRLFRRRKDSRPSGNEGESILPQHTTPDELHDGVPAMQQQHHEQHHDQQQPYRYEEVQLETETVYGYPTGGYDIRPTGGGGGGGSGDSAYHPAPQNYHYDDGIYDR